MHIKIFHSWEFALKLRSPQICQFVKMTFLKAIYETLHQNHLRLCATFEVYSQMPVNRRNVHLKYCDLPTIIKRPLTEEVVRLTFCNLKNVLCLIRASKRVQTEGEANFKYSSFVFIHPKQTTRWTTCRHL